MRHSTKDYFTCDRCGKRFDESPRNVSHFPWLIKKNLPVKLVSKMVDRKGFIMNKYLVTPEILTAIITEQYEEKSTEYDLCPECKKAFHDFMAMKI